MRINVIGTSGSGKSTLARQLATSLCIPYLKWISCLRPNWEESSDEEFFPKLEKASKPALGATEITVEPRLKWSRVDLVIWVDFAFLEPLPSICASPRPLSHRAVAKHGQQRKLCSFVQQRIHGVPHRQNLLDKQEIRVADQAEEYADLTFVRVRTPM